MCVSSKPVMFCVIFVIPSSWSNFSCKCFKLVCNKLPEIESSSIKQILRLFIHQTGFFIILTPLSHQYMRPGLQKLTIWVQKIADCFVFALSYCNFITIYTTKTKSSSLLQNLIGFLLQLTELGYVLRFEWKILAKI